MNQVMTNLYQHNKVYGIVESNIRKYKTQYKLY